MITGLFISRQATEKYDYRFITTQHLQTMKIILFLCSLLLFSFTVNSGKLPVNRWVVESNSSLFIEGRSNISPFRCDVTRYLKADTLELFKDEKGRQFIFSNSYLTIDINGFDCHQRFITNDFRKTLKATQNRYLKVHMISLGLFDTDNRQLVKGNVEIELAGVLKKVAVDFVSTPTGPGRIQMSGSKTLLFSDFNLVPPRKLAGFVRIEEEIKVNFQLCFKIIP